MELTDENIMKMSLLSGPHIHIDVFGPAAERANEKPLTAYANTAYRIYCIVHIAYHNTVYKLSVTQCELLVTHINHLGNFTGSLGETEKLCRPVGITPS